MRLHVYQPAESRSPTGKRNDGGNTRIVISDSDANQRGKEAGLSKGCSKLRVKMEIYPVSRSKFFHIMVQLLFYPRQDQSVAIADDFGDGQGSDNTMDTVELLFLAESRRSPDQNYKGTQRCRSDGSPAQSPPPLGEGAFVELTVCGELFIVNVLAENKTGRKEEGVGQNRGLDLRHRVIVKVTKKDMVEQATKADKGNQDAKGKSVSKGWLRHFPPLRRSVSDDSGGTAEQTERRRKTKGREPSLIDPFDYPVRGTPQWTPSTSPTTTTVCLQSWRVKTVSSQGTMSYSTTQDGHNNIRGSEATIVAHGMEDSTVSRGVLLNF